MAIVGPDRLLFSTDYPHQFRPGRDARRFLAECGLDDADQAAFAHGNREGLTGRIAAWPARFRAVTADGCNLRIAELAEET